jgi:hypothetical protein
MTRDRLPAFVIIGAVKAATTWTAHQLRQHPALWLPDAEPHYFSSEYHRGPDWYRDLFAPAPAGRMVGEKSADYLAHPDAAARLAATLPAARLILQLRNPVERAYSDYCMLFRRGTVRADLRQAITDPGPAETRFLQGGLYATHLRRWLRHFRRPQLRIILHEDIRTRPERVVQEICQHIHVDTHIVPAAIAERHNDGAKPMLPLAMRRALRPARPLLDPLRDNRWFAGLRSAMARPVQYPPLTPELRTLLQQHYHDDIREAEDLLQRDLGAWRSIDARQPAHAHG